VSELFEKRHGNNDRISFLEVHDRLFMPVRVLFSPEVQEQRLAWAGA